MSEVWQFESQEPVASIGTRQFPSLAEALSAAEENDEIVLLKDIAEENLTIDKSVTLTNGGKTIKILKIGDQNIFNVQSGATLTVKGSSSAPILIDGSNVAPQGRVFSSAGSLNLSYVNFANLSGTSADGTAINLWGDDNTLSLYGCSFTKVTGNGRGGAIYVVANNSITVTIEKCASRATPPRAQTAAHCSSARPARLKIAALLTTARQTTAAARYISQETAA